MMSIKPGTTGEIVFADDEIQNRIISISTTIYSETDRRIVLSQTTPPLSAADVGKRLRLTFLDTSGDSSTRYGFWARLRGFTDHEITPSQSVPALVIEKETNAETCNLRMNYRVKPATDQGLTVWLQKTPLAIVNISEGGICIRSKGDLALKPHDSIQLTIDVDGRQFAVESRVVRVWSPQMAGGAKSLQQFVSFQFLGNPAARENLLGGKLFQLERTQSKDKIR